LKEDQKETDEDEMLHSMIFEGKNDKVDHIINILQEGL